MRYTAQVGALRVTRGYRQTPFELGAVLTIPLTANVLPSLADVPDHGISTGIYVHMLHPDELRTAVLQASQQTD